MAYPVRQSSGKIATAVPSAWQARACSSTASALACGSAMTVCSVQAATRAKPWA